MEAVERAVDILYEKNIPFRRPGDYFAEMLKSDSQMQRIKGQLLVDKEKIEESEEKRRQRDMKKFGKQVQRERVQQKEKKKKEELDAIKKWRKERERGQGSSELPIDFDDETGGKKKERSSSKTPNFNKKRKADDEGANPKKKKNLTKREFKDEKYGFGGKKRGAKRNDSKSASDFSEFSRKKFQGKNDGGKVSSVSYTNSVY
jgi:rRNA-processing protein EBP2